MAQWNWGPRDRAGLWLPGPAPGWHPTTPAWPEQKRFQVLAPFQPPLSSCHPTPHHPGDRWPKWTQSLSNTPESPSFTLRDQDCVGRNIPNRVSQEVAWVTHKLQIFGHIRGEKGVPSLNVCPRSLEDRLVTRLNPQPPCTHTHMHAQCTHTHAHAHTHAHHTCTPAMIWRNMGEVPSPAGQGSTFSFQVRQDQARPSTCTP